MLLLRARARFLQRRLAVGCFTLVALALMLVLMGAGLALWLSGSARPALGYRFVPGQRLVYDIEHLSVAAMDLSHIEDSKELASPGLSRSVRASVQAKLAITVLEAEGERVLLAYRLHQPEVRLTIDDHEELALGEALEGELGRAHFVLAERRGRIQSVLLSPALGNVLSTFSRGLLAVTQVVLPASGADNPGNWEAEEDDLNGTALVHYQVAGRTGSGGRVCTLHKAKISYFAPQPTNAVDGLMVTLEHRPEGVLEASVDVRGQHLVSLEGTEATTAFAQGQAVGRTESTLRLRLVRKEIASAADLQSLSAEQTALAGMALPVPLSARLSAEAEENAVQQAELGEATVESLLRELARTEAGAKEALGETALYLKFKALVYLHPEVSAQLGKRLAGAAAQGVPMRVLPQALANSGRSEAQSALAAVVRGRPADWPALAELLPALGMAKDPTPVVDTVLFDLASGSSEEIRSTAQLALGALARGLVRSAPTRADAIVRWALAQLKDARSAAQRRQFLLVLGNAGSTSALQAIRPWLSAAEPEVRGGAVLALRWLEGPQIDGMLCKALTDDEDAIVRLEAAQALQVRPVTSATLAVYTTALPKEGAAAVRVALLESLALAAPTFPEAVELIKQASAKDPVAQVREAAKALLEDEG
jgi:hypothetical protein